MCSIWIAIRLASSITPAGFMLAVLQAAATLYIHASYRPHALATILTHNSPTYQLMKHSAHAGELLQDHHCNHSRGLTANSVPVHQSGGSFS